MACLCDKAEKEGDTIYVPCGESWVCRGQSEMTLDGETPTRQDAPWRGRGGCGAWVARNEQGAGGCGAERQRLRRDPGPCGSIGGRGTWPSPGPSAKWDTVQGLTACRVTSEPLVAPRAPQEVGAVLRKVGNPSSCCLESEFCAFEGARGPAGPASSAAPGQHPARRVLSPAHTPQPSPSDFLTNKVVLRKRVLGVCHSLQDPRSRVN